MTLEGAFRIFAYINLIVPFQMNRLFQPYVGGAVSSRMNKVLGFRIRSEFEFQMWELE